MQMHLITAFYLLSGVKTLSTFVCVKHSVTGHFICIDSIYEIVIFITKFLLFDVDLTQEILALFTKFQPKT